tara:strand:+ start:615 stop:1577 length:963 start_codon:yes stop_codon:yes gene_type:complete
MAFFVNLVDTTKSTIMKNKYLFAMLLAIFFGGLNVLNAQFTDDMEYPNGIPASSSWWDCTIGCPVIAGPNAGHNSDYAGFIPGDGITDVILNLGNKIFGTWTLSFYMYVPSGKEAYWNFQGEVPVTIGEFVVGNIFFNKQLASPGEAYIDWGAADISDDTYFDFPHDEWFSVYANFDINAGIGLATWVMYINDLEVVVPGTQFVDGNGNIPSSLGGVNLFSISADNEYYTDDFNFGDQIIANVEENTLANFSVYPNPANDEVNILFNEDIEEVRIYDLSGKLLLSGFSERVVDVSVLATGLYFIELSSLKGKSIQKFIKE